MATKVVVRLNNSAGELGARVWFLREGQDSEDVGEQIAQLTIELIEETGTLYDGDSITVTEED